MKLNGRILGTVLLLIILSFLFVGCNEGEDTPLPITQIPTETVTPTYTPSATPTVTITPNPGTPTPTATVTPDPIPAWHNYEFFLSEIEYCDESVGSELRSMDWFKDNVSEQEALFIFGVYSAAQQKRAMPHPEKGMEYLKGVIEQFPDSCLFDELSLNNGDFPLVILSQDTELLPKAAVIEKAVMIIIEDFIKIDYDSLGYNNEQYPFVVNLGDYNVNRSGNGIMIAAESEYVGIYANESTHTFGVRGPFWLNEGLTRFMQWYALEQTKNEPWFNESVIGPSAKLNLHRNLVDVGYELVFDDENVPLIDIGETYDAYSGGHRFLCEAYYLLGEDVISAICQAAHDDRKIDEHGLEKVCLDVAAEQGKTAELQELFDTRVFGN